MVNFIYLDYGFVVNGLEGLSERKELVITELESLVVADMKNVESLRRVFRGCHAVFHTSSFIDPWDRYV